MIDKDGDVWCDVCGFEYATVKSNDGEFCTKCYVENNPDVIQSTVTHYYDDRNCVYLGSDDDIDTLKDCIIEEYRLIDLE